MAFTVERIGSGLGANATEFALARNVGKNPDFYCLRRAGQMRHTIWDFLDDNNLLESELQTDPSGTHLALAVYDGKRVLSMHRPGTGKSKFQVYIGGGVWGLEDEIEFNKDTQPQIVPFGAPLRTPLQTGAAQQAAAQSAAAKLKGATAAVPLAPAPSPAPRTGSGSGSSLPGGGVSTKRPGQLATIEPVGDIKATLSVKVGRAVVGSLTPEGQLRLTSWAFQGGGDVGVALGWGASTLAGAVRSFSLAKIGENKVGSKLVGVDILVAARGTNDKLKVQRWRLTLGANGVPSAFTKISEAPDGEGIFSVSACAVQALGGTQIVTASQLGGGTLKVTAWKMEEDGGITRLTSATGSGVKAVDAVPVRGDVFATGMIESDDRFRCTFWRFPTTAGGPVELLGTDGEGKVEGGVRGLGFPGKNPRIGDAVFAVREKDVTGLRLWRHRLREV